MLWEHLLDNVWKDEEMGVDGARHWGWGVMEVDGEYCGQTEGKGGNMGGLG